MTHWLAGAWRFARRWYSPMAIVLVLFTCAAWVWLLADTGSEIAVVQGASVAANAATQEPITPIPEPVTADPRKLALGAALFRDRRLFDGQAACITCHDVTANGASSNRFDKVAGVPFNVNTPTVFNAALNFRLDWAADQDTLTLQAAHALRVDGVPANDPDAVAMRLNRDPDTRRGFQEAYGYGADRQSLLDALVIYEQSLVTPDSRFDLWLKGDRSALSQDELQGYRYFKSMGCIACHQGVNVGGNLLEHSGIFHPLTDSGSILLRVPSLRNVAMTPPYFHDGSAPTLAEAVHRMASAQLNRQLAESETQAIVAFLGSLTGNYGGTAVRRPAS